MSKNLDRKSDLAGGRELERLDHGGLGLEILPRRFTKLHGVCHPPRRSEHEAAKEVKEQYTLVRLPPYYKVQWNLDHLKGGPTIQETKYNNRLSLLEKIWNFIEVCFN